jgi:hypothetical protein
MLCRGDTPTTAAWAKGYEALLWNGQVRTMLDRQRAEYGHAHSPTRRAALHGLITHVENQDSRLSCNLFRAQGLDMGSGCVEAP